MADRASALAGLCGEGPDLIYLPEISFSFDRFLSDVSKVCEKKNNKCVVVVSEGIRFADGRYVGEFGIEETDRFGHAQMGGVCNILKRLVKEKLGVKVRAIEFSLMQRCAAHLASGTDIEEAFGAGAAASATRPAAKREKWSLWNGFRTKRTASLTA